MLAMVDVAIRKEGDGLFAYARISPRMPNADSHDFAFSTQALHQAMGRAGAKEKTLPVVEVTDRDMSFKFAGSRFTVVEQLEKLFNAFDQGEPATFVGEVAFHADMVRMGREYEFGTYFVGGLEELYQAKPRHLAPGTVMGPDGMVLIDTGHSLVERLELR